MVSNSRNKIHDANLLAYPSRDTKNLDARLSENPTRMKGIVQPTLCILNTV